jgi:3-phosphoshikimate 1-carboxyvinyltransferase
VSEIRVPGDKSISHRALLLGALARGRSSVRGILPGADPSATAGILRALGVPVPALPPDGSELRIPGVGLRGLRSPSRPLDCMNSGTTARLLLGILSGQPLEAVLTGDESLRKRPMRRVTEPLIAMGATIREVGPPGFLPLEVRGGPLHPIRYRSPVASAQVKSALLLAGLVGGCRVELFEPRRSRDHTERMLVGAGVPLEEGEAEGGWRVLLDSPPGSLPPLDLDVPGDPSSAAFFVAWALMAGSPLAIRGVGMNETRIGFLPVLERMGARIRVEPEAGAEGGEPVATLVVEGGTLRGTEVGEGEIPSLIDEIPVLAMVAARAEGVTRITGAEELRVKESDRIRALVDNLRTVGARVEELPDGLLVEGSDAPLRGRVRTHHDHRIAMAFGILGALPGNQIQVEDADVVEVSFPGFWDLLDAVGREADAEGTGAVSDASDSTPSEAPPTVVTVDGPAGSGKSSTAREVARRLGYRHLDSGALYRGLTVALVEAALPEGQWADLTPERLSGIPLRLEPGSGSSFRVVLGNRELDAELRDPVVTARVARLAGVPAVREWLLRAQREAGAAGGLVADGRDMGTVVFPDAGVKVFLTADLRERARRRLLQDGMDPDQPGLLDREALRLEERDRQDRERAASPLRQPDGALVLDTTKLTLEEQVDRVVRRVQDLTRG